MRKTAEITIKEDDKDLTFRVTQMPATETQLMAFRFLSLLCKSGLADSMFAQVRESDLPAVLGAVSKSINAGTFQKIGMVDPVEAHKFLLDLLPYCEFKVDKAYTRLNGESINQYVCEVTSLWLLEAELVKVNIGFLRTVAQYLTQVSTQESAPQDTSKPAMFLRS